MKIQKVVLNRRKKAIEITTGKRILSLPFSKLRVKPEFSDPIDSIFIDPELAREGITYSLKSGKSDSIPLSAFLDYNQDPDFLRMMALHRFTLEANKAVKSAKLSKHEICRRLSTSPSQLYRLLDPANQKKSMDEMLRLLAVLGCKVEWEITVHAA